MRTQAMNAQSGGRVLVPLGYYLYPFQSEGKTRLERVEPFRMDIRPVTAREYREFLRTHPDWKRSRVKRLFADSAYLVSWPSDDSPPDGSEGLPVTQVSWYAAKAYCSAIGARLPSTPEWERVAMEVPEGMDSAAYFSRILEWYSRPATSGSAPPDTGRLRNAFGIRDMFGRVWEWTSDFNASGPVDRGEGASKNSSFFCGGAAGSAAPGTDYATFMRYAFRSSLKPDFSLGTLGFRCAGPP